MIKIILSILLFFLLIHKHTIVAQPVFLPPYTQEERNAISPVNEGMMILNKSTHKINYYSAGKWYEVTATCLDTPTKPVLDNIKVTNNQLLVTFQNTNLAHFAILEPENIIHSTQQQHIVFANLSPNKTYQLKVWDKNECGIGEKSLALSNINVNIQEVCGADSFLIDKRDQQKYKIASINNECWMTEDLRYILTKNNDKAIKLANNEIYYAWYALSDKQTITPSDLTIKYSICPTNWHLPTPEEINNLNIFFKNAKEDDTYNIINTWNIRYKDYYDFNTNTNYTLNDRLIIWVNQTISETDASVIMINDEQIQKSSLNKNYGIKVRCVKDK